MIETTWPAFKHNLAALSLKTSYVELPDRYVLRAWNGQFMLGCEVSKRSSDTKALAEFETSYKPNFNAVDMPLRLQKVIIPIDVNLLGVQKWIDGNKVASVQCALAIGQNVLILYT